MDYVPSQYRAVWGSAWTTVLRRIQEAEGGGVRQEAEQLARLQRQEQRQGDPELSAQCRHQLRGEPLGRALTAAAGPGRPLGQPGQCLAQHRV